MFSAMETISESPYASVIDLKESKLCGKGLYNLKVDEWKNNISYKGKEPYKTFPDDIFILADIKPDSAFDLQMIETMWTFISITSSSKSDSFEVRMVNDIHLVDMKKRSLFVIYFTNVLRERHIWNSLHMFKNPKIISEVFCFNPLVSIRDGFCKLM